MARRRKLNKRVVVLLGVSGMILGLLLLAAVIMRLPKKPEKLVEEAKALLKDKQYAEAIRRFDKAARRTHKPDHLLSCAEAMLEWANNDRRLGRTERQQLVADARGRLVEAVRLKPDFLEAQRRLTDLEFLVARARGDWEIYIGALDRLLELAPDDHKAMYQRAQAKAAVAVAVPDYVKPAVADFHAAIKLSPQTESYYVALANFLGRRDRKEELEQLLRDGIQANASSVTLRVALAEFFQYADRKDEAMAMLKQAIDVQPDRADGYLAMAAYHQRQKELDEAVRVLKQAAQADPSDYRSFSSLATLYMARRKPAEAETALLDGLKAVAQSLGDDPSKLAGRELNLYRLGVLLLNHQLCDVLLDRLGAGGKREQILPRVNQALDKMRGLQETSPFAIKIEGRLALIDGKLLEAEQLLREAYDLFLPRFDAKTAELLMNLYRRLNQLGEAERIISHYLSVNPESNSARMVMARLYIDYRSYEQASRLVETVLKNQPDHEQALAAQALLEVLRGKTDRLPDTLQTLGPHDVRSLMAHAGQLWVENQQEQALRLVTDVIQRRPRDLATRVQLIQWYRQRNEMNKAQAVLDSTRNVFKDNPAALRGLEMSLEPDPQKRLRYRLVEAAGVTDPFLREIRTADAYLAAGNEDEFLQHIKAAEAINADSRGVVQRLFLFALGKQDWEMAGKYARAAARLNLDKADGRLYEAQLARAKGDLEEAVRLTCEALRQRPHFSQGYAFLGDCYLDMERLELARDAFETARKQNPTNVRALLGLIRIAVAEGDAAEYARWVRLAYRFAHHSDRVQELYLQLREEQEEPGKVIPHRELKRKDHPDDVTNLIRLGALYERVGRLAEAREVYLMLQRLTGNSAQSVRLLTDLLRRMDEDVRAQRILAQYAEAATDKQGAYLLWADYLARGQEDKKARLLYDKAIKADPNNPRGFLAAAQFEARRTNWAKAAEHQRQVLEKAGKEALPGLERVLVSYLLEAGQSQEAQRHINKALAQNPEDTEWMTLHGRAFYRVGEYAKAKQALSRTLSIDSSNARALMYRADVYRAEGELVRAAEDLKAALRADAPFAVALDLARIYQSLGDFENAYGALQSLLLDRPGYAPALRQLVDLCRANQRWDRLQQVLPEARKLYPQDPYYVREEANMWYHLKRPDRAIPMLLAAKRTLPESGAVSVLLMRAFIQAGQSDLALDLGKELRTHSEVGPSARVLNGHAYMRKNDAASAEKEFAAALASASNGPQLLFVYKQITEAYRPDMKRAARKVAEWLTLRPKDWEIRLMLGGTLGALKEYNRAEKHLKEALSLVEDDLHRARVLKQLGQVYYQLGKYGQSRAAYLAGLEITPLDMFMLNNLAWLLVSDMKRAEEALPYGERALRLAPNNAHTLDTHGVILMGLGRHAEAERAFRRSIDRKEMPDNRLHLGLLYEKTNRTSDALRELRAGWRLVQKDPGHRAYRSLRDALTRLGDQPTERAGP